MKKFLPLLITLAMFLAVSAGAQSVADVAKQSRARQKASPNAKVIDNDVIPSSIEPSSSAPASTGSTAETASSEGKKDDAGAKGETAKEENKTGQEKSANPEDQKNIDGWKKLINEEKKEINQLTRELNVAQREAGLHNAVYYADAGTMLRDQAKFAEDSRKMQAEIDAKTQALAEAKQKLADLQEQARKSGVPSNQLD